MVYTIDDLKKMKVMCDVNDDCYWNPKFVYFEDKQGNKFGTDFNDLDWNDYTVDVYDWTKEPVYTLKIGYTLKMDAERYDDVYIMSLALYEAIKDNLDNVDAYVAKNMNLEDKLKWIINNTYSDINVALKIEGMDKEVKGTVFLVEQCSLEDFGLIIHEANAYAKIYKNDKDYYKKCYIYSDSDNKDVYNSNKTVPVVVHNILLNIPIYLHKLYEAVEI